MIHLSITFPKELKVALDQEAEREHTRRSTLIQKAVKAYLGAKRQRALRELLKEGYLEMTEQDKKAIEDFKYVDAGAWSDLD